MFQLRPPTKQWGLGEGMEINRLQDHTDRGRPLASVCLACNVMEERADDSRNVNANVSWMLSDISNPKAESNHYGHYQKRIL